MYFTYRTSVSPTVRRLVFLDRNATPVIAARPETSDGKSKKPPRSVKLAVAPKIKKKKSYH